MSVYWILFVTYIWADTKTLALGHAMRDDHTHSIRNELEELPLRQTWPLFLTCLYTFVYPPVVIIWSVIILVRTVMA